MNSSFLKRLVVRVFGKLLNLKNKGLYTFHHLDSPTPLLLPLNYHYDPLKHINSGTDSKHRELVYICSPTQRSGTNFLSNILQLCNDIYIPTGDHLPKEHFIYSHANLLSQYFRKTLGYWDKWVKEKDTLQEIHREMLAYAGDGIINYFLKEQQNAGQRLLLRTPDSGNLEYFFNLFPNGQVICILRDGRDTVDSFTRSFSGDWAFKKMCKRWAARVDHIMMIKDQLEKANQNRKLLLVKYEELNTAPQRPVEDLLNFLGISKSNFEWDKLKKIPVVGSSTQYEKQTGDFWQPSFKADPKMFSNKWVNWSTRKKRIFKKIAGDQLIKTGYEKGFDW